MRLTSFFASLAFAAAGVAGMASVATSAAAPPAASPAAPPAPGASLDAAAKVSVLTGDQVIQILDETVDWYRTLGVQQQNANQPSDLLIVYANRQTADQVVDLAFEIARANAELLSSEASAGQPAVPEASSPQALTLQQNALDAQRQAIQREMAAKAVSGAKLPELQGELAMVSARKNLLDTMSEFVDANDPKGAGANALKSHIDAIAASVPNSATAAAAVGAAAPATTASGVAAATALDRSSVPAGRYGIWDLGVNVLKLLGKMSAISGIDLHTVDLADTFEQISAPSLSQLKAYASRSDLLAKQADHADSAELKSLRDQFDTLAWLFKQTSAILIPLTKEQVLLRQYRHNLANWHDATYRQYREAWTALGIRVAVLAGVLAVIVASAEVWRHGVLRYAHEARRRQQLLLVRKIVLWILVIVVLGLSFVSELSALATFAGLLTAGLAVAMQSVLVSVVGYFFLIGKYGIRVGDRVQIGLVVGEVIELGLVRMHLMELSAQGPLRPTGRVVAFANLIVFQASGGLFKQIPGVTLSWHETSLSLPDTGDYPVLKERLLTVVTEVLNEYRVELARQTREIERTTASTSVDSATPQVQMHLVSGRMEALIRYPVHFEHAAEIDERVSEAVLKVVAEAR